MAALSNFMGKILDFNYPFVIGSSFPRKKKCRESLARMSYKPDLVRRYVCPELKKLPAQKNSASKR